MTTQMLKAISPRELHEQFQKSPGLRLIDVRTPVEYGERHARGAALLPLYALDAKDFLSGGGGGGEAQEVSYFICRKGDRSKAACRRLIEAGMTNVAYVEGGTEAWEREGLPIERAGVGVSLERQVRIAAGLLVLVGAVLGAFAHPAWLAIPAFVGGGLVFSGVTDTCGMGKALARMPWNRS